MSCQEGPPKPRQITSWLCGFYERASEHIGGSFTTGAGTFCSSCGERIYNSQYDGYVSNDVEERRVFYLDRLKNNFR